MATGELLDPISMRPPGQCAQRKTTSVPVTTSRNLIIPINLSNMAYQGGEV